MSEQKRTDTDALARDSQLPEAGSLEDQNPESDAIPNPQSIEAQPLVPISEIPRLSEIERPLTNVEWLAQEPTPTSVGEEEVVQVTGVRLNPIPSGLEVILETRSGQQLQAFTSSEGNTLIADIPNTQLALPEDQEFRSNNPAIGITSVTVTQRNANSIRVTVIGTSALPTAEVIPSAQGLVLSLSTPPASAEAPSAPETPKPEMPQKEPSTTPAPGVEPEAAPEAPEVEEEIEIVVTAEQEEEGYRVPDATTGTRTDTPLRDIPQSIQVVPEQVLEDQQVIRLEEALRNVSGVSPADSFGNADEFFVIRGFTQSTFLRNGFRQGEANRGIRETANLERIEVLKGPASVLYGTVEPGGVVNLITEQPLEFSFYSGELIVGNFGFVQPSIDISGPLNEDRTLLYRLNALYQRSDGFRDFEQDIERVFIVPVLTWQISDRTDLTLEFEYLDDERPFDRGLVAIDDEVADIPFDRILGEPDDVFKRENFLATSLLEHRFSENWTLRSAFQFTTEDQENRRASPGSLNEDTGDLTRDWDDQEANLNNYQLQANLVGQFATGSVEHTLLFGIDLFRETRDFDNRYELGSTINIFDPIYNLAPRPEREDIIESRSLFDYRTDILGIYLQDQITLFDNLKLLAGGRFDIIDQDNSFTEFAFGDLVSETDEQRQDDAFTPRVGIVYQPIEPLSLYASYSESFVPNLGVTIDNEFLEPERSKQYEVGIRGEFLDGRLYANLAAFEITKSNVATPAPPPNEDFSVAVGEQRSRGIELDVAGEILPGWNIIASYAYIDAEISEDNDLELEGNRLPNVPENSASLWTTYEIQQGDLQGLGFGLGFFFTSEREGDLDNSFQL